MKIMNVGVLQMDITWADAPANVARIDQLLPQADDIDLLVLPETFSTGFCMEPEGVAEPEDGYTLTQMRRWAAALDCAVVGSVPVAGEGRFYNRMYFVCPDGTTHWYDKRHLFAFGGENRCYAPGKERVVVEFRGFRFLLQVCYDLRFPVWSRCREKDYDAIIYVANWPESRRHVWNVLLRARALENQCYVVGVNRVGDGQGVAYRGGSVIINPYGKEISSCPDGEESLSFGTLERAALDKFRQHFPVLDDADSFELVSE